MNGTDGIKKPLIEYFTGNTEGRMIDRWVHYFDVYHHHFSRFRALPITIIEIGVFNGGSLRMWKNYFGPQSTIVGVDINPECQKFAEPGIDIVIGDQGDRAFLRALADRYPGFSILIDDGGHTMHQQIATFDELYLRMDPAGIYLCEDTHTSYWPAFGGGYKQPHSFIENMKALIDRLHAFHSPDTNQLAPDHFTVSTDSIHFYDSIVVFEKKPRQPPQRISSGKIADFRYIGPSLSGR